MALVNATRSRFLARQPILTADKFVFAYEILSRSSAENYCIFGPGESPHFKAMDELFVMGMKKMTHGLPAFLNCTREFLLHDYIELLPRESVVGEILETVEPDSEVLDACRRLKARGYRFALDDYEDRSSLEPFFEIADFVKVDFLTTSLEEQQRLGEKFRRLSIPLIAERVETYEQFERARSFGYRFFQGYFFCRPEVIGRRRIPANKGIYLQLLRAARGSRLDLDEVARVIRQEVTLSYRLLRYLNSPAFSLVGEIRSIPQAVALLGERAIQKWIAVVSLAGISDERPEELLRVPLVRARFCELLAYAAEMQDRADDLFLLGLMSVMDALLNMSMVDVLASLPLDRDITDALKGHSNALRMIFEVALDYETGTWDQISQSVRALHLEEDLIPELYLNAMAWAEQIIAETAVPVAP